MLLSRRGHRKKKSTVNVVNATGNVRLVNETKKWEHTRVVSTRLWIGIGIRQKGLFLFLGASFRPSDDRKKKHHRGKSLHIFLHAMSTSF